jgi:hypothetical protein
VGKGETKHKVRHLRKGAHRVLGISFHFNFYFWPSGRARGAYFLLGKHHCLSCWLSKGGFFKWKIAFPT